LDDAVLTVPTKQKDSADTRHSRWVAKASSTTMLQGVAQIQFRMQRLPGWGGVTKPTVAAAAATSGISGRLDWSNFEFPYKIHDRIGPLSSG